MCYRNLDTVIAYKTRPNCGKARIPQTHFREEATPLVMNAPSTQGHAMCPLGHCPTTGRRRWAAGLSGRQRASRGLHRGIWVRALPLVHFVFVAKSLNQALLSFDIFWQKAHDFDGQNVLGSL